RYIIEELVPHIKHQTNHQGPMIATGCSMGGYHSLNFYLRHPDVFDSVIALSGLYDVRYFFGDYHDRNAYENSPIDYLWNLNDGWFLDKYRSGNIIVATGQGNWEEVSIKDTKKIEEALRFKNIPAWIDFWGENVHHDWEWWRVQMPYFLGKLNEQGKLN
ncbi:MAG: alpha/beta fold hydrolase, partial [Trichococcus flocculiformis]